MVVVMEFCTLGMNDADTRVIFPAFNLDFQDIWKKKGKGYDFRIQ